MSFDLNGKWVFLSGPMTGKPDWNKKAFEDAEGWCVEHGALYVYNPAKAAPAEGRDAKPHEAYMLGTLHELTEQRAYDDGRPRYDVVLLLDGWKESKGAMAEVKVANECGIDCYTLRNAMRWAGDGDGR